MQPSCCDALSLNQTIDLIKNIYVLVIIKSSKQNPKVSQIDEHKEYVIKTMLSQKRKFSACFDKSSCALFEMPPNAFAIKTLCPQSYLENFLS